MTSRRKFIQTCLAVPAFTQLSENREGNVLTVRGKVSAKDLGKTLAHEHVLVDFVGAEKISFDRWEHDAVIKKVLPFLLEIKKRGINSIGECTPAFIGRDVKLLQKLSEKSGLHMITNTGYYGASDNKFLPSIAKTETAIQLADRFCPQ